MILLINTADEAKVFIGLVSGQKLIGSKNFLASHRQAEKLLVEIDKMLKKIKVSLKDVKGIAVVTGPGPFTALRIGVVTANTLAWSLKIPISGLTKEEFTDLDSLVLKAVKKLKTKKRGIVLPFYGKEPNITKRKVKSNGV